MLMAIMVDDYAERYRRAISSTPIEQMRLIYVCHHAMVNGIRSLKSCVFPVLPWSDSKASENRNLLLLHAQYYHKVLFSLRSTNL